MPSFKKASGKTPALKIINVSMLFEKLVVDSNRSVTASQKMNFWVRLRRRSRGRRGLSSYCRTKVDWLSRRPAARSSGQPGTRPQQLRLAVLSFARWAARPVLLLSKRYVPVPYCRLGFRGVSLYIMQNYLCRPPPRGNSYR